MGVTTALVAALMTPSQALGASPGPPSPAVPAGRTPGPAATVTLITGDKVTVTPGPAGTPASVSVQRPPGATGSVRVLADGSDTYVYPDDVVPYIASDRLDRRLFNVTQLVAQGYDDARARELPLIVSHLKSAAARRSFAALPGVEAGIDLPSINGEALLAGRSRAAQFWSALTGTGTERQKNRASAGQRLPDGPSFAFGVDRIWLDGKAEAFLADTTAHIGAPTAWAAGTTGTGVKVAVLDTGADTAHPDLVDRVVATESFVPDQDVTDRDGHGTHTASTVAGTGAASGGKERGVAPSADLMVGKVLDNDGVGQESWIIAGMEWAARTEHAKVVNMSLGNRYLTDQSDPMSQSLNALSAETGALFVVAAGNAGPSPYSLSAPGTADAALTVGVVDTSDRLDPRSSSGPRGLDDGLKPDITAPGIDVLAARSQYAASGEGYYQTLSGTSMAAPHVAGAAVLLAQQHPDWTGRQIKDALMSSSVRTPAYTPYRAGTGRVDVAAAYDAPVVATGSVDAGLVQWSSSGTQPVAREIVYTNTADHPVALDLSLDPGDSAAGVFALASDHVDLPAHGSARVGLTADPRGRAAGQYSAQVLARDGSGAVLAHTAAGVSVEPERYNLTVRMKDRSGRPMGGFIEIRSTKGSSFAEVPEDGTLTQRLAPGPYTVLTFAEVEGTHGPHSLGVALLAAPEVDLTTDREVPLDASRARQVRAITPKPSAVVSSRLEIYRSFTSDKPTAGDGGLVESVFPDSRYDSLWALPTDDHSVKKGSFVFTTRLRTQQTPLTIAYDDRTLDDALVQRGSPPLPEGNTRFDTVFAGTGSAGEYAGVPARGRAVVVRAGSEVPPSDQAAAAHEAGAAMLLVVNDGTGRKNDWYGDPDNVTAGPLPVASVTQDEGEALIRDIAASRKQRVRLAIEAHPAPEYLYDLVDYHSGSVPEDPSLVADPGALARLDLDFAQPPGKRATETRVDYPPYLWGAASQTSGDSVAPGERTDWVSAGGNVRWQQFAYLPGWMGSGNLPTAYRPGSKQDERWLGPVVRPRLLDNDLPVRDETSLSFYVGGFGDSGTAHTGSAEYGTAMSQHVELYQGERQLLSTDSSYVYAYDLDPGTLPYRLVADTTGDTGFSPYSTATRTEWRFTSGASAPGTVPLAQLDYAADLDAAGRARRTADLAITPVLPGIAPAEDAVSGAGLEVSYDDGATWHRQDLQEKKGTWRTSLRAPSGADFVSLRVTADQRSGTSVTQTVIRAFGLV
ncbi:MULTISPECIES: S8 family serine peptidase [unclassified Streptomyces]|uniref:S8 family serine peptidase n=1 Tax=unclassified Streptomyces TaxID=2593676 RepID=UPI0038121680